LTRTRSMKMEIKSRERVMSTFDQLKKKFGDKPKEPLHLPSLIAHCDMCERDTGTKVRFMRWGPKNACRNPPRPLGTPPLEGIFPTHGKNLSTRPAGEGLRACEATKWPNLGNFGAGFSNAWNFGGWFFQALETSVSSVYSVVNIFPDLRKRDEDVASTFSFCDLCALSRLIKSPLL